MSGFISALVKQRRDAKKSAPDMRGRFNEIVGIIRKYDYDDGITPEIVVGIIQDLGPTFVKIGQIASQQSEYIPPEYCDALAKLRSSVAPMDLETVYAQIEKHLGKPVDELFASFDDRPLGSASIGQVHRAELFDGTVVAVKVRRPGVVDTVARDFALLENVLDTFAKNGIGGMDVKGFVLELEKTSKIELDFTNEATNLERFWKNNAERACIESPKCYREFTNEAILTEDFVIGHEVGDGDYVGSLEDGERDRIAALIADNFASQVLVDGFYHADPHSGNVLIKEPVLGESAAGEEAAGVTVDAGEALVEAAVAVSAEESSVKTEAAAVAEAGPTKDGATPAAEKPTEDGSTAAEKTPVENGAAPAAEGATAEDKLQLPNHSIEWIDFGMMGLLTAQQRQILLDLVTCIVMQDAYGLKRTVMKVAQPQGDVDHGAMLEMCEGMCGQYAGGDFGDFELGDLLGTVIGNLQDESYKIDPFLTNLARGIVAVEGTVKALSPHINILNYFIEKADVGLGIDIDFNNLDDETIEELKGPLAIQLMKFLESSSKASAKTAESLDMLEKGQIRLSTDFNFEQKGLESVNQIARYVVRALMIIALFLGSCLLCTVPPNAMEGTQLPAVFPVMGFIGYVVSLWLAFFLYRSMRKRK